MPAQDHVHAQFDEFVNGAFRFGHHLVVLIIGRWGKVMVGHDNACRAR